MQRLQFFAVKCCEECFIHLFSGLSNLLEFPLPNCCQFHNVTTSVSWVSLPLDEPSLFKNIEECDHIGAINRKLLCQVLLGCLINGFKQQQNPVMRGLQFPSTKNLRKLTASFSSQAAQQVGLI